MNFFKQVRLGVSSYSDAHRLIFKHKLWGYIIAPGIINIIIFIVSTLFIFQLSNTAVEVFLKFISEHLNISEFITSNKSWMSFIISLAIKVLFFFAYLSVYKYIILFLMSPLLALLSERVEKIISGKEYPFQFTDFIKDEIGRAHV